MQGSNENAYHMPRLNETAPDFDAATNTWEQEVVRLSGQVVSPVFPPG